MHIETLPLGEFEANCYIVWEPPATTALVVDPGAEADRVLAVLDRNALRPAAYLLTHGHMDHIGAVAALQARHPAPVAIHATDLPWAFSSANQMRPYYDTPRRPSTIDRVLNDGETWEEAGLPYNAIHTPGHSPGCVCYYFQSQHILFTGDTLFEGSVGRTDLPGGDRVVLDRSLRVLAALPAHTRVYPGHGPETTIQKEIRSNPFLRQL